MTIRLLALTLNFYSYMYVVALAPADTCINDLSCISKEIAGLCPAINNFQKAASRYYVRIDQLSDRCHPVKLAVTVCNEDTNDITARLKARDRYTIDAALSELHITHAPHSIEPLLRLVENPEFAYRAITALGEQGDLEAIPDLVVVSLNEQFPEEIRSLALQTVGVLGGISALPILLPIAEDQREVSCRRTGALTGLGKIFAELKTGDVADATKCDVASALVKIAADKNEPAGLRILSAQALAQVRCTAVVPALRDAFSQSDKGQLGFWLAVAYVMSSDGSTSSSRMYYVIKDYKVHLEGDHSDIAAKESALEIMQRNAGKSYMNAIWLIAIVGICCAITMSVLRGFRRKENA